jgi:hypothetical protein
MTSVVAKTADLKADLDLEWLLKVRTVVARTARWILRAGGIQMGIGLQGASVLRRELPRNALLRAGPVGLPGRPSAIVY